MSQPHGLPQFRRLAPVGPVLFPLQCQESPTDMKLPRNSEVGDSDGSLPVDSILSRGRRMISELKSSSSETAKALEKASSSRCDLERQLQEWRKESEAKKQRSNPGLTIPPRMSLDRFDHFRETGRRLPSAPSSPLRTEGISVFSEFGNPASSADRTKAVACGASGGANVSSIDVASEKSFATVNGSSQATILPAPVMAGCVGLGDGSSPSAPSTPPRALRQLQTEILNSGSFSQVSDVCGTGCTVDGSNKEEEAALRRYLSAVKSAIVERDRELKELKELGSPHIIPKHLEAISKSVDMQDLQEEIRKEQAELQRLEEALQFANLRIKEGEERLQLRQEDSAASRDSSGHLSECMVATATAASGCPSSASTAPTMPSNAEQVWQERARAVEREIKSEAAQALELQDRVHWLRAQLRKQPRAQEDRMTSIQRLFEQIQEQLCILEGGMQTSSEASLGRL